MSSDPTEDGDPGSIAPAHPAGVLVLGMHRSGTSAATRLVNLLGPRTCVAEDLINDPRGNSKGHWESQTLVDLNDRILGDMGRAWWCPPPALEHYCEAAARVSVTPAEAVEVFDKVHVSSPWVWKDPRATVTLPFWRAALARPMVAVVIFRNPLDVAASLQRRNKFSTFLGVALWERYNRLLLAHLDGLPTLVSRYDDLVRAPVAWSEETRRFLAGQGVAVVPAVDTEEVARFIDADLRHSRHTRTVLRATFPSVALVHDALEAQVGAHAAFVSPQLPGELPSTEAELVAIALQASPPLPRPSPPSLSVIGIAGAADPAEYAGRLARSIPSFAEALVVCTEVPSMDPGPNIRFVKVPSGIRRGQARSLAVEQSEAGILLFRDPTVQMPQGWAAEVRHAVAAGFDAVAPGITTPSGRGGYGLSWTEDSLAVQWLPSRIDEPHEIPFLPDPCFAVTREAYDDVGGFDPLLGANGRDVHELCLRLWRLGHRCGVVPSALATLDEPGVHGADEAWFVHDVLRLATLHLGPPGLTTVIRALEPRPEFPEAMASVLLGDAVERAQALRDRGARDTGWVLGRFGLGIGTGDTGAS